MVNEPCIGETTFSSRRANCAPSFVQDVHCRLQIPKCSTHKLERSTKSKQQICCVSLLDSMAVGTVFPWLVHIDPMKWREPKAPETPHHLFRWARGLGSLDFMALFDIEATRTTAFKGVVLLPQFPDHPSILSLADLPTVAATVKRQVHWDGTREGRAVIGTQAFQIRDIVPGYALPRRDIGQGQV